MCNEGLYTVYQRLFVTLLIISQLNPNLILTKCFEEVSRGKLSVEENGAVVNVESPAHADQQDLQAAYRVATDRGKDMEMDRWRRRRGRAKEE